MKNSTLCLMLALCFLQGLFCVSAQSAGDTLTWKWEVSTTTSTKTKSCVLEYTGGLQLDWGDGVVQVLPDSMSGKTLSHVYSVIGTHPCQAVSTKLTYFKADSRKISTIDPTKAPNLTYLSVTSNLLSAIDLSRNSVLASLYVGSNSLSDLDLKDCQNLQTLTCSDNQLKTLDLSMLNLLKKATCHTNALTSVLVSSVGALNYFSCHTCSLEVAALDSLLMRLPVLSAASTSKNLFILDNPGTAGCRIAMATTKKWTPDKGLTTGTLFLNDASCPAGDSVLVEVMMDNPLPIVAMEMNLTVPSGLSLDTVRSCLTARRGGHTLSISTIGTRTFKVLSWSMTSKDCFTGNSGAVIQLFLKSSTMSGSYTLSLDDVILVDTASKVADFITMDGIVTVTPDLKSGDVNGDEAVDVTDIVCLVAYIHGRKSEGFQPSMADLDGNGLWNVVDITRMVNLINGGNALRSANGAPAAESSDDINMAGNLRLFVPQAVQGGNHFYLRTCDVRSDCLELCLNNEDSIQAFQTDLCLPEGVRLEVSQSLGKENRFNGHSLQITSLDNNRYRILCFSYRPDCPFQGNRDALVVLPLQLSETLKSGNYPCRLEKTILTGLDLKTAVNREYDCLAFLDRANSVPGAIRAGSEPSLLWVSGSGMKEVRISDLSGRIWKPQLAEGQTLLQQPLPAGFYLTRILLNTGKEQVCKVVVP